MARPDGKGNSMEYALGIDVGTTGCKATVFDRLGTICQQAYCEYPVMTYTGMIDPELVWDCVCGVIRQCTARYPRIVAICTTSFGESVVAVDESGQILGPSFLYTDDSAAEQWQTLNGRLGVDRIYALTGYVSHPMYTVNRLMWIQQHEPERYEKTAWFLFFGSFIAWKLCGVAATEDTHAARSMMYDIHTGAWCTEILEAAGLDGRKLPPIVCAGTRLAETTAEMCALLGLEAPAAVVAGGHDQPCVALGLGALSGGCAALGYGTVECLTLVLDQLTLHPTLQANNFICSPHVIPGKYVTYAVLFSGGVTVRDLRNRCYGAEHAAARRQGGDVYDRMMEEAAAQSTDVLMIPHLVGSGTPEMRTTDTGILHGLRLSTTRGELVRAALEGLSFDLRRNLEILEACQLPVDRIVVSGGGAQNRRALQIRSNALGRTLHLPQDVQAGTRGAFLIAARAMGWIASYAEPKALDTIAVEPQEDRTGQYQRFCRLHQLTQAMDSREG